MLFFLSLGRPAGRHMADIGPRLASGAGNVGLTRRLRPCLDRPVRTPIRLAATGSRPRSRASGGRRTRRDPLVVGGPLGPQPRPLVLVAARPWTARDPPGRSTVTSGCAWRLSHQAGSASAQPFMAMVTRSDRPRSSRGWPRAPRRCGARPSAGAACPSGRPSRSGGRTGRR